MTAITFIIGGLATEIYGIGSPQWWFAAALVALVLFRPEQKKPESN